jgi:hypothetical protein
MLFLLLTLGWISCGDGALKKNLKSVFWQIIQLLCGVTPSSFAYETLWIVLMQQVDILYASASN